MKKMTNGRRKLKNLVRCLMIKMGVWTFYKFIRENTAIFKVIGCNLNYARQIKRLRLKQKDEKIRVLFIVSEIAKWKEQKLYDAFHPRRRPAEKSAVSAGRLFLFVRIKQPAQVRQLRNI